MLIGLVLVWMVVLSRYDVRQHRLPNRLTIPGFAAITLGAVGAGHGRAALIGAAALGTVYLLVHLLAPVAMGAGDVKLALGTGGFTGCFGTDVWLLAAIGAPLLTVVTGTAARMVWSARTVPHGPSMCAASAAAVGLALC